MRILHQWDSMKQQIRDAFQMNADGSIVHHIPHNDINCFLKQVGGSYLAWALIQDEKQLFFMRAKYDHQSQEKSVCVVPAEKTLIVNTIFSLDKAIIGCRTDSIREILIEEKNGLSSSHDISSDKPKRPTVNPPVVFNLSILYFLNPIF